MRHSNVNNEINNEQNDQNDSIVNLDNTDHDKFTLDIENIDITENENVPESIKKQKIEEIPKKT